MAIKRKFISPADTAPPPAPGAGARSPETGLERIVSGGQTGVDRAALDFAIAHDIPHGGWCPRGRLAEDGAIASRYALHETPDSDYAQRTEWNIRDSDGTVIFTIGPDLTGGSALTRDLASAYGRPWLHLSRDRDGASAAGRLRDFLQKHRIKALNVAGPRLSTEPAARDFAFGLLEGLAKRPFPDSELVGRAQAGDLAAFEELTARYERKVYTLAMRILRHEHDAEDVTQQTFLSALENLRGFRGESGFATWLFRIATHAALKVLRKRRGLETVSLEEATEPRGDTGAVAHPEFIADWRQSPGELVRQNETRRLLDDALARLDEKHRLVFLLRDVEGLSVKETAGALGLSEANVKVRLLRARLQLRERLTRVFGDRARRVHRGPHPE